MAAGSEFEDNRRDLSGAAGRWDRILGLLAHELRKPLGPIRTAAFLLKGKGAQDPEVEQIRLIIERQTTLLAGLVETMQEAAKAERKDERLPPEPVALDALLGQTLAAWQPLLEARGHRLSLELFGAPLMVAADPAPLEQLLATLVGNACNFTPPGGEIHIQAIRQGDSVGLLVRDNGIGMTAETLARLFTLFYRAEDPALPQARRGLGVDLALARQFAQRQGGSLTARSDGPGLGSEFRLLMPALEPVPAQVGGPLAQPAPRPEGQRVLIIDDDGNDRLLHAILLADHGFEVAQADSGEAGLAMARLQRPDIALVDFEMPGGLGGLEVASGLRATLGHSLFLVALTGHSDGEARAQALVAGFDAFLVKGSDPGDLVSTLRNRPRPTVATELLRGRSGGGW